jgi:hypothetical protein
VEVPTSPRQGGFHARRAWGRSIKTWKVPYKTVCKLGLEQRIIDEAYEKKNIKSI